jgi:hypothetical protein
MMNQPIVRKSLLEALERLVPITEALPEFEDAPPEEVEF